ncbi:glycoside hydrolase family 26 protein [uncultured Muriicola sp.]|uniref:glycoside hydrolase family 26 protein n=1 Tax=uncultured Muriicola sp. TaxID=1583102 RepID=UPI00261E5EFA|nr:glycosyl hydrolase [uncultured Muriicola sp.]
MFKRDVTILLLLVVISLSFGCLDRTREKEGDWDGCVIGMYPENGNETLPSADEQEINDFEKIIGHKIGSVVWFPTWDDEFPTKSCEMLYKRGIIPHLTWELFWPSKDPNNTRQTGPNGYEGFNDVLAGKYDEYIDRFARDAKAFDQRVLIRFLHEFNGNWYVWSGNKNGNVEGGPEKVVAVWKYVVDRFKKIGADNVKWLWVPHGPSTDLSTEAWNDVSNYWPGDAYVDWIGLDGYNFYPQDPWGGARPLRDFDNCFRDLYDSCAVLGKQPMMIAEFGTGEFQSGNFNKAAWVRDAFTKIKTEYPRLKIFTWFNINKELDWRVNSSPEALSTFRTAMQDPYFIGSPYKQ